MGPFQIRSIWELSTVHWKIPKWNQNFTFSTKFNILKIPPSILKKSTFSMKAFWNEWRTTTKKKNPPKMHNFFMDSNQDSTKGRLFPPKGLPIFFFFLKRDFTNKWKQFTNSKFLICFNIFNVPKRTNWKKRTSSKALLSSSTNSVWNFKMLKLTESYLSKNSIFSVTNVHVFPSYHERWQKTASFGIQDYIFTNEYRNC